MKILFDVCPCYDKQVPMWEIKTGVDICSYFNGQTAFKKLYFDCKKYPRVANNTKICSSFVKLKEDLELAALNSGSPVVANGGRPDRQFSNVLCATVQGKVVENLGKVVVIGKEIAGRPSAVW